MEPSSRKRVLVVDDEQLQRLIVTRMLATAGVETDAAGTIAEACALLACERYDVVLLDLSLRDEDSLGLLHRLVEAGQAPAILFISGMDSRVRAASSRVAEALGLPVAGTLSKPVQADKLRAMMAAAPCARTAVSASHGIAPTAQDLAAALDAGEIVVHYQPKVALGTGAIVGMEALTRWPRAGAPVSPDVFIPLAEETGLIGRLTELVLRTALVTCSGLRSGGVPGCSVAVNVSAISLGDGDLPCIIDDALSAEGLPPGALIIELTESAAIGNAVLAAECLTRLRIRGISLSIDDFGTGHSSLLSLLRLPFSELKIDKSFVLGSPTDPEAGKIVRATVALARELGLRTVAEGVETRELAETLRGMGCDVGQGWLFGRPMDRDALVQLCASHRGAQACVTAA